MTVNLCGDTEHGRMWREELCPGAMRRVEFEGARMLFPEELSDELRAHWNNAM
jgi:hypothetical protein